jgi:hypothetical protein
MRIALSVIFALWATFVEALPPVASAPSPMRTIPFAQAPRQVRDDLLRVMASCGAPAARVRAHATFDVGPLGGPGRRDYFFEAAPGAGDGRVSICTGNFTWQVIWLHLSGDRYMKVLRTNNLIFVGPKRSLLFDADVESNCAAPRASGWSDNGRFWAWKPRAARYEPVTRCMLREDATAWAKARGYRLAEWY